MENPKVEGNYTTIFKDGSIILYNPWSISSNGKGKWYWDEDIRGGVIHWFAPEEDYKEHKYYKLPDWELRSLYEDALRFDALCAEGVDNWEWYGEAMRNFLKENKAEDFEELVDNDLNNGYYKGYEIK